MIKYATDVIFMEVKSNNISDFFFTEIQKKANTKYYLRKIKQLLFLVLKKNTIKRPLLFPI